MGRDDPGSHSERVEQTGDMMAAPALSVIVPSVNGWDDLEQVLRALEAERSDVDLEAVVPERCGGDVPGRIAAAFPWVRVVPVPRALPIPGMRSAAIGVASAPAVAVIEDHVIVPRGWARQLLVAHGRGEHVLGGAVINGATARVRDWAAFLCEYSHLLPPLAAGPAAILTGNNTLYARDVIEFHRPLLDAGRWEDELHAAMTAQGLTLHCHPEIVVTHAKRFSIGEYTVQRFLYSRAYAGARASGASMARRWMRGVALCALPPVLFFRIVSTVLGKGVHRQELARAWPLIAWYVTVWSAGEIVGTLAGAGDALARVR